MKLAAERIKSLRDERGLTQVELGKVIGVSKSSICRWEKDQADLKGEYAIRLAEYFDVSIDYLLGKTEY